MTNQQLREKFEQDLFDCSQKLFSPNQGTMENLSLALRLEGWTVEKDFQQEKLESFFPVFVIKPDGDASVENCYEMLESLNDPKWELIEEWREEFADGLVFCGLVPVKRMSVDFRQTLGDIIPQ